MCRPPLHFMPRLGFFPGENQRQFGLRPGSCDMYNAQQKVLPFVQVRHPTNFMTNQNNKVMGHKPKTKKRAHSPTPNKSNKRDALPANNKYSCDICDRGFKCEDDFTAHMGSHVKCKYDGCSFSAHPKVVLKHIHWYHLTGCADKIKQLECADEIAKWREERRQNYPTKENIAKKKAQQKEQQQRGDVLSNKFFGKFRRNAGGRRSWKSQYWRQEKTKTDPTIKDSLAQNAPDTQGQRMQPEQNLNVSSDPLSCLIKGTDESSSSDDNEPPVDVPLVKSVQELPNALGSIASLYGHGSSSEDEGLSQASHNVNIADKKESLDDCVCANIDEKQIAAEASTRGKRTSWNENDGKRKKRKRKRNKSGDVHQSVVRKPTLLEKLLAPEIRHERNVILQCVRYVVSQNFFNDTSK